MKKTIILIVACLAVTGCGQSRTPDEEAVVAFDAYMRGDFTNALRQFNAGAAERDPFSLYMLALSHERGSGIPRDATRAIALYKQSAELGYPYAWRALGVCHRDGVGTPRAPEQARECFTKAIDGGVVTALSDLGAMYLTGDGVERDEKKAVDLYTQAAQAGDPRAKHNLGEMHYFGRYFPEDQAAGCKWFADAANDGFINSIVWVVALADAGSTNIPVVSPENPIRKQIENSQMQDVSAQLTAALRSGNAEEIERARLIASRRSYWFGILR